MRDDPIRPLRRLMTGGWRPAVAFDRKLGMRSLAMLHARQR